MLSSSDMEKVIYSNRITEILACIIKQENKIKAYISDRKESFSVNVWR